MFDVSTLSTRLAIFGYTVTTDDAAALAYCVDKISDIIKSNTNRSSVPEGLDFVANDMAAAEFLLNKKTFAPSSLTGFNLDYAVKQIKTGDTDTVFATGSASLTPEQRLDAFISYLLNHGKAEFTAYRCLKW